MAPLHALACADSVFVSCLAPPHELLPAPRPSGGRDMRARALAAGRAPTRAMWPRHAAVPARQSRRGAGGAVAAVAEERWGGRGEGVGAAPEAPAPPACATADAHVGGRPYWSTSAQQWPGSANLGQFWADASQIEQSLASTAKQRPSWAGFGRTWAEPRLPTACFGNFWICGEQPFGNFRVTSFRAIRPLQGRRHQISMALLGVAQIWRRRWLGGFQHGRRCEFVVIQSSVGARDSFFMSIRIRPKISCFEPRISGEFGQLWLDIGQCSMNVAAPAVISTCFRRHFRGDLGHRAQL